jgi:hypothetical protein
VTRVLDSLQDVAKLAGGALCRRGGIIEFMSQPRGKLPQRSQSVPLLFYPGGFTDAVRHQTHESLSQLRHFLHEIGKQCRRKSQDRAVGYGSSSHHKLLHSRKGKHSGDAARLRGKYESFAGELSPCLKLPIENHKHGIRGITLAHVGIARLDLEFL